MIIYEKKSEESEKQNVSNTYRIKTLEYLNLLGDLEDINALQTTSRFPSFLFVTCIFKYRVALHRKVGEKRCR